MNDVEMNTPNGKGYACGKLPNGKILVAHGWSDLNKQFRNGYDGPKCSVVIQNYREDEPDVKN